MVPKRVFQRPALSIECERGVQLGATVQASVSHMEGFSVMHRINGLRQSLSSIVASRAASSERYATPLVSQDSCEIKAPDTTAEQLLVASQQRVEDLLKENHRLELLCMNQAHVMQNASVQSTQSLKQRQTSATTSAVEGGGCALGHWTPKVSTNKATARLQPECADGVEKWPTSTESFFVPEDVGMAVKRLVCTAVSVVPEMGMHEGDVTGFRTDDGALKTSEVLLFVEGNLERWVRASRECVDVETAGSMVCRSLAHFESNQREWCTTLSELIKRLQKWQWLQRQTILEGERRTLALKREMELLSCEMSKAVEERAECECRCAQLERALSKAMEKQCEDNVVVQRLQQECSKLRSDADALFHLAGAKQRRGAATDKPDCHRELSTVPGGPCSLKEHTTSVPGLSAISVAVGTEESLGTDVTGSASHPHLLLAEEHVLLHPLYIDMSKKAVELEAKVEELSTSLTETTARAHAAELERQRLDKAVLYLQEKLADLQSKLQGESTRRSDLQISPAWAAGCGIGVNHVLQLSDTTKPVVTGKDFIPRVSRDFAAVIRALDADIFSLAKDNEAHLKSEIFFHIGYNIAKDAGLFEASVQCVPEGCWRAFLSALRDNYSDDRFDSAERAADNAQFFYALLFHSGLLTHLTRTELTAAILASLCSTYRSARLQKSIADDVTSHANTASVGVFDIFSSAKLLQELMSRCSQEMFGHWGKEERELLFQTTGAILSPGLELLTGAEYVVHRCATELSADLSSRFNDASVRMTILHLFIVLSQHAHTMRTFEVHKHWAELYSQRQSTSWTEPEYPARGVDLSNNFQPVAIAQVVIINMIVAPICRVVVRACPALKPCEQALENNMREWISNVPQCVDLYRSYDCSHFSCSASRAATEERSSLKTGANTHEVQEKVRYGTLLVDTARFIEGQQSALALYKENKSLRSLVQGLLCEVESAKGV